MDEKTASTARPSIAETLGLDTESRPRPQRHWRALAVTGVAVVLGLFALFMRPSGPAYEAAPVTKGPFRVEVTATGTLEPLNKVDVGAEISGRFVSVLVDFNDTVKEGQEL